MSEKNGIPDNFSGVVEFKFIETDFATGKEKGVIYIKHYRNGLLHREDGPAILL
ncbi:hypothetical protein M4R22_02740 [Acidovorax sp. GBBC 3334]|uniref:hypothetical protein n=1 Tax=Acidovorax sp. GBBC 3334 TaxID=2940496 RepID=UPI0023049219|nr:hypothetical protein [Acidovorax sp. GBBC 3334]MDA8453673.1 hypothetical protein [Acidovorax sp. GBBC 3334]